jgi:hypothetical protein
MKIRELLQVEIWSKRTTRKILVGFAVVVGFLVAWQVLERYWLTPGERRAGKEAVVQIDAMQNLGLISDEDFDAKDKQAAGKVEAAEHAAWTDRDKGIADLISGYLMMTEVDRGEIQTTVLEWQRHASVKSSQEDLQRKLSLSGTEVRSMLRMELHGLLD